MVYSVIYSLDIPSSSKTLDTPNHKNLPQKQ